MALSLLIAAHPSNGQETGRLKVWLGLGYAIQQEASSLGGGPALWLEPSYRLSRNVVIGLRLESASLAPQLTLLNVNAGPNPSDIILPTEKSMTYSVSINGQYYFTKNGFRPYLGIGVGYFLLPSVSSNGITISEAVNTFGVYPRTGFDYGHFTLALDFNIIPLQTTTTALHITTERNASYLALKVGYSIWRNKK